MTNKNNSLNVVINGKAVLEFDRNKTIPGEHRQYLDNMDARMDEGVHLGDEFVSSLNPLQKAQFVANSMVNGILNDDFNQAIAMCTYLGDRLPDLLQVVCKGQEDETGMQIEFVYDKEYQQEQAKTVEQTIKFFDPKDYVNH